MWRAQAFTRVHRACLTTTIHHLMRTVPRERTIYAARLLDECLVTTGIAISGLAPVLALPYIAPHGPRIRAQFALRLHEGGWGVVPIAGIADAAYVASIRASAEQITNALDLTHIQAAPLIAGLEVAVSRLQSAGAPLPGTYADVLVPEPPAPGHQPGDAPTREHTLQSKLSEAIHVRAYNEYLAYIVSVMSPACVAHFLSAGGDSGGLWLRANPGLHSQRIPDKAFLIATRLRFLLPFTPGPFNCAVYQPLPGQPATKESDEYCLHARDCKRTNTRNSAHLLLLDTLVLSFKPLLAVGRNWSIKKEQMADEYYSRLPDQKSRCRVDAVLIPLSANARTRLLDTTVTDAATSAALAAGSAERRGVAVTQADDLKVAKYTRRVGVDAADVYPCAMEVHGYISPRFMRLIHFVASQAHSTFDGQRKKRVPSQPEHSRAVLLIACNISAALQIGNADCIQHWLHTCAGQGSSRRLSLPGRGPSRAPPTATPSAGTRKRGRSRGRAGAAGSPSERGSASRGLTSIPGSPGSLLFSPVASSPSSPGPSRAHTRGESAALAESTPCGSDRIAELVRQYSSYSVHAGGAPSPAPLPALPLPSSSPSSASPTQVLEQEEDTE